MSDRSPAAPATADDWLDAALRAEGREHRAEYVADDGFTASVMAKLPPPLAAPLPTWRRRAVIGLWTAAGIGAVIAFPGTYADFAREYFRVVAGYPVSLAQIVSGVVMLGIGSWTAMVWALRRG